MHVLGSTIGGRFNRRGQPLRSTFQDTRNMVEREKDQAHIMTGFKNIRCFPPQSSIKEKTTASVLDDGNETGSWIAKNVPSLREDFKLSPWLPGGNLQTLWTVLTDSPFKVEYERIHLRVPDGGTIGLDLTPLRHADLPEDAPIVVICHGMTGGSHESYVKEVLADVTRRKADGGLGARGVVVNFRGCAGTPVTSPQLYSLGTTLDLSLALHYLRAHYPRAQIHGVGFSLGAAVLTHYLAETGESSLLSSGMALGCPWNIRSMVDGPRSNPPSRLLYTRIIAQLMLGIFCALYALNPSMWDTSGLDVKRLKRMRRWWLTGGATMKEVENVLAAKVGGPRGEGLWPFKDSGEMYDWACPTDALQDIRRPLLAINAFNDPLIDGHAFPRQAFSQSSHAFGAITPEGGHLGWTTSLRGTYANGQPVSRRWITRPIGEYLKAAVRDLTPCGTVTLESMNKNGQQWELVSKGGHAVQGGGEVGWAIVDMTRTR